MEVPDFNKILVNLRNALDQRSSSEELCAALKKAKEQRDEFHERYNDLLQQSLSWTINQSELQDLKEKYNSLVKEHEVVKQKCDALEKEKEDLSKKIEELKAYSENKYEELYMHLQCDLQIKRKEYEEGTKNLKERFENELSKNEAHYKELLNDRNDKLRQAMSSNTQLKSELIAIRQKIQFDERSARTLRSEEEKRLQEQLEFAQTQINRLQKDLQQALTVNKRETLATRSKAGPSTPKTIGLNIDKIDEKNTYEFRNFDNLSQRKTLTCPTRLTNSSITVPVPVPKARPFSYKRQKPVNNRSATDEKHEDSTKISSTTVCTPQPSTSSGAPDKSNNTRRKLPVRKRKLLNDTLLNLFSEEED